MKFHAVLFRLSSWKRGEDGGEGFASAAPVASIRTLTLPLSLANGEASPESLEREIDNSPTPPLGAASIPPFRQAGFRNFRNRSLVIMRGVVEKGQSRVCGISKIDNI